MACLKVTGPHGVRLLPEAPDGNVRGMLPGEAIVEPVWDCGPQQLGDNMDMERVFTAGGIMVGNAVKKITHTLGFKHCLKCSGRQRKLNQKGLEIQQRVKDIFA